MAVGARVVLRPGSAAFAPVHAPPTEAAGEAGLGMIGVHEAGLNPLGLVLPVDRQGDVVVGLHRYVETEWLLREEDADQQSGGSEDDECLTRNHELHPWSQDSRIPKEHSRQCS